MARSGHPILCASSLSRPVVCRQSSGPASPTAATSQSILMTRIMHQKPQQGSTVLLLLQESWIFQCRCWWHMTLSCLSQDCFQLLNCMCRSIIRGIISIYYVYLGHCAHWDDHAPTTLQLFHQRLGKLCSNKKWAQTPRRLATHPHPMAYIHFHRDDTFYSILLLSLIFYATTFQLFSSLSVKCVTDFGLDRCTGKEQQIQIRCHMHTCCSCPYMNGIVRCTFFVSKFPISTCTD